MRPWLRRRGVRLGRARSSTTWAAVRVRCPRLPFPARRPSYGSTIAPWQLD